MITPKRKKFVALDKQIDEKTSVKRQKTKLIDQKTLKLSPKNLEKSNTDHIFVRSAFLSGPYKVPFSVILIEGL